MFRAAGSKPHELQAGKATVYSAILPSDASVGDRNRLIFDGSIRNRILGAGWGGYE